MPTPARFSLLIAAALALPAGICAAQSPAVPENDYQALKIKIRPAKKDVSAIRSWLERNLSPSADPEKMLSPQCREYSNDITAMAWGYEEHITAEQVEKKWAHRFDTRNSWDHPFENGNCGWMSRKLAGFDYLGELNGGDWFLLTIKGGCGENDYSETLQRVAKVVSQNGTYQITNLINPQQ